ncbi:uncharacterized protein LOC127870923 isoform X2 [Dreissena polymorpha]|uniref:uncharacterized protein LOC127870923 isoform X2 n=1 Tax=Dreissena polymorpha TaxID=45954 RepID=UPI0022640087|nr:uncharacterized protein LOC127870923 isoform X2 [Dreissena polymorpha]
MGLSKRRAHLRKLWFKKGGVNPNKGRTTVFPALGDNKYVRLEKKAFDSQVHTSNNVLTFKDTVDTDTTVSVTVLRPRPHASNSNTNKLMEEDSCLFCQKAVRPRPHASNVVDEHSYCGVESLHPDLCTNKLVREDSCLICQKTIRSLQHGITCDVCERWQHRTCNTGIQAADYFRAKRGDIVLTFTCKDCRNHPTTPDATLNSDNVSKMTMMEIIGLRSKHHDAITLEKASS